MPQTDVKISKVFRYQETRNFAMCLISCTIKEQPIIHFETPQNIYENEIS